MKMIEIRMNKTEKKQRQYDKNEVAGHNRFRGLFFFNRSEFIIYSFQFFSFSDLNVLWLNQAQNIFHVVDFDTDRSPWSNRGLQINLVNEWMIEFPFNDKILIHEFLLNSFLRTNVYNKNLLVNNWWLVPCISL